MSVTSTYQRAISPRGTEHAVRDARFTFCGLPVREEIGGVDGRYAIIADGEFEPGCKLCQRKIMREDRGHNALWAWRADRP